MSDIHSIELTHSELEELESMLEIELTQTRRELRRTTPNSDFKEYVRRHEQFLSNLLTKVRSVRHGQIAAA